MFAICNLSMIPLRQSPSDTAEMVNQLLFGETMEVLSSKDNWLKVISLHDYYEGYLDEKQVKLMESTLTSKYIVNRPLLEIESNMLTFGCLLHKGLIDAESLSELIANKSIIPMVDLKYDSKLVQQTAMKFLSAPYLWGGRSIFGIDCSGFTQVVFRLCGVSLLRDAYQQAAMGSAIAFEDLKTGDLAFFNKDKSVKITHVGIVLKDDSKTQIIHASGKVRIDSLTNKGIIHSDNQAQTHHYLFARRVDSN